LEAGVPDKRYLLLSVLHPTRPAVQIYCSEGWVYSDEMPLYEAVDCRHVAVDDQPQQQRLLMRKETVT
jgi:hypothetical protein